MHLESICAFEEFVCIWRAFFSFRELYVHLESFLCIKEFMCIVSNSCSSEEVHVYMSAFIHLESILCISTGFVHFILVGLSEPSIRPYNSFNPYLYIII